MGIANTPFDTADNAYQYANMLSLNDTAIGQQTIQGIIQADQGNCPWLGGQIGGVTPNWFAVGNAQTFNVFISGTAHAYAGVGPDLELSLSHCTVSACWI